MSIEEMLERLSARELLQWKAYERIEPFGEIRADIRMAIQTAALVNLQRSRGSRVAKVTDFMPDFAGRYTAKEQSVEEMMTVIRGGI